jgi:hypothetical protein
MADPVTWGLIISATAAGVGAVGMVRQAQAQASAADYNAKLAKQNAAVSEAQGLAAAEAQQRDSARKMGSAMANYGASGVQLADGSAEDVLADSARQSTLDNLTLKYNARLKTLGFLDQAGLDEANSKNAMSAGYLNATSSLLSSAGSMYGKYGGTGGGTKIPEYSSMSTPDYNGTNGGFGWKGGTGGM